MCGIDEGMSESFMEFVVEEISENPEIHAMVSIRKKCMFRSTFCEKKLIFHEKKYL